MRAVKVRCGVVRLLYVRHKSHAVGKPIALFFGRHSAVQFGAETVAAFVAFLRIAADPITASWGRIGGRFNCKFNDKPAFRSQAFANAAKVRMA
jgi:hypothetical protein